MKRVLLSMLVVAGCSSGGGSNGPPMDLAMPPMPGWSLTGTMAGFDLQTEAVSGEAHAVSTAVLVQLSSRAKVCDLLQQNSCPNGRLLVFRIGSHNTGSFTVVDRDSLSSTQARIFFLDLDTQCFEDTRVAATSGRLTVSAADLTAGGLYSFAFDADTPDGPISGVVRAAFCQI